ncbi:MAG: RIP metalloprotease RseP [Erysipelotrichaceae bacterium]|nr:RIP metalloprotease RseP [Erysipelotrichaceae bacterium]
MTIIYFLLLLSVIICIHEAGHLAAAKIFNVYCYEYSFGMGPLLFQKQGKETKYSIRALPIGGYVSMAGETDAQDVYPDVEVPEGRRLNDIAKWKKIIILLAGVFMNFVLAWLIFSMIMLGTGAYAESPKAEVGSLMENSAAEKAGFLPGDKILTVTKADGNSANPKTYLDLQVFLADNEDGELLYTIQRGEQVLDITVTPEYNEEHGSYLIGIVGPDAEVRSVNLLNCWWYGVLEMRSIMRIMITTLISLIHGFGLNQLSGPVGIYNAAGEAASYGLASFVMLIGELSLNVGIFNLLPVPVLDGGQVVVTLVEAVLHRELNEKLKTAVMAACWVLLIAMMLYVTWNDISRLIF